MEKVWKEEGMRKKEIHNSHINKKRLARYLDGQITKDMKKHLELCKDCQHSVMRAMGVIVM